MNIKSLSIEMIVKLLGTARLELSPTHDRLCFPVIKRIYRKMVKGIKFRGIKVADTLIIDGHHRYIASLLANVYLDRFPSNITSATKVISWEAVEFVEDDWDTEAKIRLLNKADADYNGISLQRLNQLLE